MFVSTAFAQDAAPAATSPDSLLQLAPLVLVFAVFYFLLIRPQQKKMKQHREMIAGIRRGDRVVTGGGIIGTVSKVVDDNEVQVEIAEGVRVRVQRPAISAIVTRTGTGSDAKDAAKEPGKGVAVKAANDGASEASGGEPASEAPPAKPAGRTSRFSKILGGKTD
ncbi:MAG: preprotein translocase subunit YajC [Rhodospirillales bacterium]|nr:preprotein translocase subunit YajC [Rhodospirillales bacterium]